MGSRFDFIRYDGKSIEISEGLKSQVHVLELTLNNVRESREKSLAITKLEEAFMWMGKAIKVDQLAREAERK